MALENWESVGEPARSGGQGYVERVRRIGTEEYGALKRLHGDAAKQRERRFRFLTEVSSLKAMAGNGAPVVLDSNEEEWESGERELYLVMEFISGPTLAEMVDRAPPTLDEALNATQRILEVIASGHRLSIHHRDLKPNNIILRDGSWNDPILVDLGTSWRGLDANEAVDRTPDGREMGNRFLRLPEFAPGGEHHDARSDIAMTAGLLFFMLARRAPRVLIDHQGRLPHEVEPSPFSLAVLNDARWPRIARALTIAFQQRLEARFRDADEFLGRLQALKAPEMEQEDHLDAELARLRDTLAGADVRQRTEAAPAMMAASLELYQSLQAIFGEVDLVAPGQGPVMRDNGRECQSYCVVSRRDQIDPRVTLYCRVRLEGERYLAFWVIDGGGPSAEFYEGPMADGEALMLACKGQARTAAAASIGCLTAKLGQ